MSKENRESTVSGALFRTRQLRMGNFAAWSLSVCRIRSVVEGGGVLRTAREKPAPIRHTGFSPGTLGRQFSFSIAGSLLSDHTQRNERAGSLCLLWPTSVARPQAHPPRWCPCSGSGVPCATARNEQCSVRLTRQRTASLKRCHTARPRALASRGAGMSGASRRKRLLSQLFTRQQRRTSFPFPAPGP